MANYFKNWSAFWATICKTIRPMLSHQCLSCPVCLSVKVGVLWLNEWMDQDATWYGGRLSPRHIALNGDPAPPPAKGAQQPPTFRPMSVVCCGQMVA